MKTTNKNKLKILFKLALLALFVISVSCTSESAIDPVEELNAVNAKSENAAKATRAWWGKFTNAADLSIPLVSCIPDVGFNLTTNIISGNMTHLGKIQPGSFGRPQAGTCFLTGPNTADVIYNVNYIGAHGDMITTEEAVTITVDFAADPTGLTGTFENSRDAAGNIIPIKILSGTGRFEGATGELYFVNATFSPNPDGSPTTVGDWELVGELLGKFARLGFPFGCFHCRGNPKRADVSSRTSSCILSRSLSFQREFSWMINFPSG